MRVLAAALLCALGAGALAPDVSTTRRKLVAFGPKAAALTAFAAVVFAPKAATASGVSLEEAAKNAEKYRVKAGVCTPTNPADCTKQYSQMLDPRFGKSKEEQAAMDARNDKELGSLRSMMEAYEYKPSK